MLTGAGFPVGRHQKCPTDPRVEWVDNYPLTHDLRLSTDRALHFSPAHVRLYRRRSLTGRDRLLYFATGACAPNPGLSWIPLSGPRLARRVCAIGRPIISLFRRRFVRLSSRENVPPIPGWSGFQNGLFTCLGLDSKQGLFHRNPMKGVAEHGRTMLTSHRSCRGLPGWSGTPGSTHVLSPCRSYVGAAPSKGRDSSLHYALPLSSDTIPRITAEREGAIVGDQMLTAGIYRAPAGACTTPAPDPARP